MSRPFRARGAPYGSAAALGGLAQPSRQIAPPSRYLCTRAHVHPQKRGEAPFEPSNFVVAYIDRLQSGEAAAEHRKDGKLAEQLPRAGLVVEGGGSCPGADQ
jgi:hypothetical protein